MRGQVRAKQKGGGKRLDVPGLRHRTVAIQENGKADRKFFEMPLYPPARFGDRNCDDAHRDIIIMIIMSGDEAFERLYFRAAWLAPGCEEMHQHRTPAVIGEGTARAGNAGKNEFRFAVVRKDVQRFIRIDELWRWRRFRKTRPYNYACGRGGGRHRQQICERASAARPRTNARLLKMPAPNLGSDH